METMLLALNGLLYTIFKILVGEMSFAFLFRGMYTKLFKNLLVA